jgi:hypothetical protein
MTITFYAAKDEALDLSLTLRDAADLMALLQIPFDYDGSVNNQAIRGSIAEARKILKVRGCEFTRSSTTYKSYMGEPVIDKGLTLPRLESYLDQLDKIVIESMKANRRFVPWG